MARALRKIRPIFYAGDELHAIKQKKVRHALSRPGSTPSCSSRPKRSATSPISTSRGSGPSWSRNTSCWSRRAGRPSSATSPAATIFASATGPTSPMRAACRRRRLGEGDRRHAVGLRSGQRPHRHRPDALHGLRGPQAAISGLAISDAGPIWSELTAVKHPEEVEAHPPRGRDRRSGVAAAIAMCGRASASTPSRRKPSTPCARPARSSSRSSRSSPPAPTPRSSSASRPRS